LLLKLFKEYEIPIEKQFIIINNGTILSNKFEPNDLIIDLIDKNEKNDSYDLCVYIVSETLLSLKQLETQWYCSRCLFLNNKACEFCMKCKSAKREEKLSESFECLICLEKEIEASLGYHLNSCYHRFCK
jgi:hypothetical protein